MIENFLSKKDAPAPYEFWFILMGIGNQLSCKDAGSWLVTTYDYDADTKEHFVVDNQRQSFSFIAEPGSIAPVGDIEVNDPTNFADDVMYSFKYQGESLVPANGYLKIQIP